MTKSALHRHPRQGRSTAVPGQPATRRRPDLRYERALLRGGAKFVAGMDEVGRGALAGPVSVGVVVVEHGTRPAPAGVADSKLLSPQARHALQAPMRDWCAAWAVGHAGSAEIDAHGIIAALRLAGRRALAQVRRAVGEVDAIILDGSHDWLSASGPVDLFEAHDGDPDGDAHGSDPVVHTRVKADLHCASVAAASVFAKCERDDLMTRFAGQFPMFGWAQNMGYATPVHVAGLREHGPTSLHRRSWRLPGRDSMADDGGHAPPSVDLLDALSEDTPGVVR